MYIVKKLLSFLCEQVKAKKIQKEEEWKYEVMTNNLILLRHLTEIASSKRVPDGNKKKVNFLTIIFLLQKIIAFFKNCISSNF